MKIDHLSLQKIFKKKPFVGILGSGISGQSAASLLEKISIKYCIFDEDKKTGYELLNSSNVKNIDLFVYSPGFKLNHPFIQTVKKSQKSFIGEWDLGAFFWEGPIISVTGTNGKTTLTEFLAYALRNVGKEAVALGNNGYSLCQGALDRIKNNLGPAIGVCEISSFQAENIQILKSSALLWTNISEDHLDRYKTLKNYFNAKLNLIHHLKGPFIAGNSVLTYAKKYKIELNTIIADRNNISIPKKSPFLPYPQVENYALAKKYWEYEQLPIESLEKSAILFNLPEHRLAKVDTIQGVEFWNDSKATNFDAVLAALKTFKQPVIWIGGGKNKATNTRVFCKKIYKKIKKAFLIGETAPILFDFLKKLGISAKVCPDLDTAVLSAYKSSIPSDIVLLSPGFSSLDMFKNYSERGNFFKNAVLCLKK